jgi:hypothetical protein
MASTTQLFTINGLIDTSKNVWQNAENIATAAQAWITYDNYRQQWGVVINQAGNSTRSFNDTNILGQITLTESKSEDIYNSCEISFPNRDILDRVDYIRYDPPIEDRFDYEPDNQLRVQTDLVNDAVQAEVIALTELKQSRLTKIINFQTDFTNLDLQPGDIIDVTIDFWDYDQKLFRVIKIDESESGAGPIVLSITALEYSADVYDYTGIERLERTTEIGIANIQSNTNIQTTKDETTGVQVGRALATDVGSSAISAGGIPLYDSLQVGYTDTEIDTAWTTNQSASVILTVIADVKLIQVNFEGAYGTVDYDVYIDGVSESRSFVGHLPTGITLQYSADDITYGSPLRIRNLNYGNNSTTMSITDAPAGYYKVQFGPVPLRDLDQDVPGSVTTDKSDVAITNVATQVNPDGDAISVNFVVLG